MAKPPTPQRPPTQPGSPFGQGGSYLGEDEPQDVTQSGLEQEEKTQAHIVPQPPVVSRAPLLPAPELDWNEKTFKRQGPPPLPARPAAHDYDEKTLKRPGAGVPFFTPGDIEGFRVPAPPTAGAPELPPETPTRQLDQADFQKLVDEVRDVLPELSSGSEEATAVHLLTAPPEPAGFPEPGPEGPTGVIDERVLKLQAAARPEEEAPACQAPESLELTPELPEDPEPAPELPESPPEDKTTMQPFPEGPGLAQRARALWSKVQPQAAAAWQRARRRPALLVAAGSAVVVAIAAAAFLLFGESAAEREARTVQLRTATDGTVARVVVEEDDRVRKGQLLLVVKVDRPAAGSPEFAALEKSLQAAQTALQRAKSGAELKKIAAEVARKRAAVSAATRDEVVVAARVKKKKATVEQLALATVKVHGAEERLAKATDRQAQLEAKAPADVARAQGEVDAAQSELDMARAKASLVEIRSPVDGVVVTPDLAQIPGKKVHRGDAILAVLADER